MELDDDKEVCATCEDWKAKRELKDGKVTTKPSARGICARLKKVKPPHGGCDYWKKWEGSTDEE